jgi:hypothetical protein
VTTAPRENVFKKLALEREAKRLEREAAGEPKPVSPYTKAQIEQARKDLNQGNNGEAAATAAALRASVCRTPLESEAFDWAESVAIDCAANNTDAIADRAESGQSLADAMREDIADRLVNTFANITATEMHELRAFGDTAGAARARRLIAAARTVAARLTTKE